MLHPGSYSMYMGGGMDISVFLYSELPVLVCPVLTNEQKPEPWIEKSL